MCRYNVFGINSSLEVRCVSLNISKAFDRVRHKGLLNKIKCVSIYQNFLKLIEWAFSCNWPGRYSTIRNNLTQLYISSNSACNSVHRHYCGWHCLLADSFLLDNYTFTKEVEIVSVRSSQKRFSIKNVVFNNFTIFSGKHLCWSLFLIKLQAWRIAKENCEVLKNTNFEEHLQRSTCIVFANQLTI